MANLPDGHLSTAECAELAHWAARCEGERALEVGHWKGLSTCVLLGALPAGVVLVSVDHHRGDRWVPAVPKSEYEDNVHPFVGDVVLVNRYEDFRSVVPDYYGFGFVFYDADHSVEASRDFWMLVRGRMLPDAVFCFDDGDWEGGQELARLVGRAGYWEVTRRPIERLGGDKENPKTHTLRVFRNDGRCL